MFKRLRESDYFGQNHDISYFTRVLSPIVLFQVLPVEWLDKLTTIAKSHNIPVHMDGARIMNAAVAIKVAPKRIVKDIDSVCFCLSKSLGAPIGSVLLGTKSFIDR